MDEMQKLGEQLASAAPFVGTALMGCILQAVKTRWQGWHNFALSAATAGFGAWLLYWLVGAEYMSTGLGMFASGMVGYSGGTLVDVMLATFSGKVEQFDPKGKE